MSNKDIIEKQADYILSLEKQVAKLKAELKKQGKNPPPTEVEPPESIKERKAVAKKRERLPAWVRRTLD